jgi:hypothetical protein
MSATGAWRLTMNTPFGVQTPLLKIDGASGALESDRGSAALEDLKIDGDKISFSSKVPTPMGEFRCRSRPKSRAIRSPAITRR